MEEGDAAKRLKGFETDRAAGRWYLSEVSLADLVAEAIQISSCIPSPEVIAPSISCTWRTPVW